MSRIRIERYPYKTRSNKVIRRKQKPIDVKLILYGSGSNKTINGTKHKRLEGLRLKTTDSI